MGGISRVVGACRAMAIALNGASAVARNVDTPYTMFRILPTARWLDTLFGMASALPFWLGLLVLQFAILFTGIYLAESWFHIGLALDTCRVTASCQDQNLPDWARWLSTIEHCPTFLLYPSVLLPFFGTAILMQVGWVAAASFQLQRRQNVLAWILSLGKGISAFPRAAWMGFLPMRLVSLVCQGKTDSLQNIDIRWRVMILGRLFHFVLLSLIATGTPLSRWNESACAAVKLHHREMLDAIGTYNLILVFNILVTVGLVFVPKLLGVRLSDFTSAQQSLAIAILCMPMLFARLLMISHYARTMNPAANG